MRTLIEYRLNNIKDHHSGFPKDTMRWRNFNVEIGNKEYHISEVNWSTQTDEELLRLYERLIRQMSKVM